MYKSGRYKNIATILLILFTLSIGIDSLFAKTKIVPVADVTLLGGQYFLKNESSSFGGNFDLFYTPVINFTSEKALLPIVSLTYRGTKDVRELVGGGTLTQEYLDTSLSLKYVHKINDTLKIKPRIGYKTEYLKETKDETWQRGLFDYDKTIGGVEFEKNLTGGVNNLRIGYDYYTMKYPNYSSLISQGEFQTAVDTTTYSEISTNAGVNVLDYNTGELFADFIHSFNETVQGRIAYDIAWKSFPDQHIVNETGQFTTGLRNDTVHLLTLSYQKQTNKKTLLSITDYVQNYISNQNSYDANQTKYIPKFYNFFQNSITPSLTLSIGKKHPYKRLNIYLDLTIRGYGDRLAQDEAGNYLSEKVSQTTTSLGTGYTIPIERYKGLSAYFNINYRTSSSNMKYEKYYKYNYYVSNYFLGLNWKY